MKRRVPQHVGLPATIAFLSLVSACNRGRSNEMESSAMASRASATTSSVVTPRLRLETTSLDMGQLQFDEPAKAVLPVMNDGESPLLVERIEPSPRCSATTDRVTVPPHGQNTLEITCKSDLWGPLREQLTLHSNDPSNAALTFQVIGTVAPLLAFDNALALQEMPFGQTRQLETRLIGKFSSSAKLSIVPLRDTAIEVAVLPAERHTPAGLRLSCKGDRVGEHVGQITVQTGIAEPKEIQLSWACKVIGTLEVSPTNPYFNLKISGPQVLYLEVRSRQPAFELRAVRVKQGPYVATIVPGDSPGLRRIKVEFADELHSDETRGAAGTLVIFSNDKTEPVKEIPLTALGNRNRASAPER